jgi:hypothetical protein
MEPTETIMKQRTTLRLGLAAALLFCATARAQNDGQLVVASTPPGATITVDGKALGKAPVIAKGLLPGDHVIQADWGDGRQMTSVQKVQSGGSQVVQMTAPAPAVPQLGNLVVVTDPGGADVVVDGKVLGKAPLAAQNLTAGDHNVVARFVNGTTASGVAHVVAGSSAVLQLKGPPAPVVAPAPVVTPAPGTPPSGTPPSGMAPGAAPGTTPAPAPGTPDSPRATPTTITSTTPGSAPPPPEGATPPPGSTAPATPAPSSEAAPPPAVTPAPTATPASEALVTEPAPPKHEKKKKWVVPVVVGVIVGVVVIGTAVGLGVGLSGGNSRYGIAEF